MSWASPVTAIWSARKRPKGLSCDVTLETTDDVALRFALRQAALHVGNSARFVLAEAGDHDPPDGVVGLAVAAAVEPVTVVDLAGHRGHGGDPAQHRPFGFGGDPFRVTIMGQSAGAGSAFSLQASPQARGLFHRIVGMSGGGMRFGVDLPTQAEAEASGLELEKALRVDSLAALRNIPADRILAAQAEFQLGGTAGTVRFRPNLDAHFMPRQPRETFAAGVQNDVPLLIGFTRDESSNDLRAAANLAQFREAAQKYFGERSDEFLRLYAATEADVSSKGAQAARDGGMATSMRSWAYAQMQKGREPVFMYMYAHPHSYANGATFADLDPQAAGAYHSSEIPFFLLNLDAYNRIRPTRAWTGQDRALAATMSDVLVAFASQGSPQTSSVRLPRFDAKREQLIEFGDPTRVISFNKSRMEFFSTVNAPGAVGPARAPRMPRD